MVTVQKNNQSVNNESSSARLANLGTSFKNNNHKISTKEQGLFLQLLHNYPDGVISVIDKKYNFIYTGGQLHLRLSANPVELIGNKLYPKFPENIRKLIKAQLKKVFAGDRISAFELPGLIKGEFHTMDAFPLKENDDSIAYAGVIIRNISHLKIAEEELRISLRNEKDNADSCHAHKLFAGISIVNDDNLELYVGIIMNGYDARADYGVMPPVGTTANLSAAEITAIMNHERSTWGNNAKKVTEEEIKKIMDFVKLQAPK